ncbi:hypothetical protein ACOJBO_08185 [Rhizobium beringeri]
MAWFQIWAPDSRAAVFWSNAPCRELAEPMAFAWLLSVEVLALIAAATAASALTTMADIPRLQRLDALTDGQKDRQVAICNRGSGERRSADGCSAYLLNAGKIGFRRDT